jgi:predicted RecA/RadA family phage recombinase
MANTSPIFALVPETKIVTVTTATTDRTGATTTNLVELLTAGTDGTKITQIGAKVAGTNTATLVLIFITDTAGANPKLFDEIGLTLITATNTVTSQREITVYSDLQLKSGQKVLVGTTVAQAAGVNIFAIKGDY